MTDHVLTLLRRVEQALQSKSLDERTRLELWADVRTEIAIAERLGERATTPLRVAK